MLSSIGTIWKEEGLLGFFVYVSLSEFLANLTQSETFVFDQLPHPGLALIPHSHLPAEREVAVPTP